MSEVGSSLQCPNTNLGLFIPESLKVLHDYKVKTEQASPEDLIKKSWAGKVTQTNFGKSCIICGSTSSIEMHHVKSVKDVRSKYLNKETLSFAQFEGAVKRKQVPICKYHHQLYHQGLLSHQDLVAIYNYKS